MQKISKTRQLLISALFVCILLSLSVTYITNAFIGAAGSLAPYGYSGETLSDSSLIGRFHRTFFRNEDSLSFIREYEYRLFGFVNHDNVFVGEDDFLFRVEDEENHYNYLKDYMGEFTFNEEKSALILKNLQERQQFYKSLGSEYLLVILPNAQTVYSEKMPPYLGTISPNTRLSVLCDYLQQNEFTHVLNMTASLQSYKGHGMPLYDNTENTLNALGLYYTYLAVCMSFSDNAYKAENVIMPGMLQFYQYYTAGRGIAVEAGLENVVKNMTVSLSNETKLDYSVSENTGFALKTVRHELGGVSANSISSLLLQFTGNRDRLLSETFFSNTFDYITYQPGLDYSEEAYAMANPSVVVQFIHENELSLLFEDAGIH